MTDTLTPEKRSWNMAQIRSKDTTIEVKVRRYLFKCGFRFRKNDKRYPGKPDVVLPRYKTVIFIHGCFWHRHPNCKIATTPKSNTEFWENKFKRNVENDKKDKSLLEANGWKVIVLWQCDIEKRFEPTMAALIKEIKSNPK